MLKIQEEVIANLMEEIQQSPEDCATAKEIANMDVLQGASVAVMISSMISGPEKSIRGGLALLFLAGYKAAIRKEQLEN